MNHFIVRSLKYDGSIRRTWECEYVGRDERSVTVAGQFEFDVHHTDLGHIKRGTRSIETFYFGQWFNLFEFYEPDGSFRNRYYNICIPPQVSEGTISYVDLDIDIIQWPDGRVATLDVEEFEANAERYNYPIEIRESVFETLQRLLEELKRSS